MFCGSQMSFYVVTLAAIYNLRSCALHLRSKYLQYILSMELQLLSLCRVKE